MNLTSVGSNRMVGRYRGCASAAEGPTFGVSEPTTTSVHGHANCHVSEGTYADEVVNKEAGMGAVGDHDGR